jgi:hypothetical protein
MDGQLDRSPTREPLAGRLISITHLAVHVRDHHEREGYGQRCDGAEETH